MSNNVIAIIGSGEYSEVLAYEMDRVLTLNALIFEHKYRSPKEKIKRQFLGDTAYYFVNGLWYNRKSLKEEKIFLKEYGIKCQEKKHFKSKSTKYRHRVLHIDSCNESKSMDMIKSLNPDIILIFGTSILSRDFIGLARKCVLNFHCSLLPYFKGSVPEFWQSYYDRYDLVGITLHKVGASIDGGDILLQKKTKTSGTENYLTLRRKNIETIIDMLPDVDYFLTENNLLFVPQEKIKNDIIYKYKMITFEIRERYWNNYDSKFY